MGKPGTASSSSKPATEKKKSKKRERVEEEEEVYVVEKILDKRVLEDGTVLYYLKWRVRTTSISMVTGYVLLVLPWLQGTYY